MANETFVTLIGTLFKDPETRYTADGKAVTNLTVVVNARKFNKQTNEWDRKPGKFWRCVAWDQGKMTLAQNLADGLKDKDSVIVYGEIQTREYEQDGKKRTADEVRIETIGKDLRWHKPSENATSSGGFARGQQDEDPWATAAPTNNGFADEPPY